MKIEKRTETLMNILLYPIIFAANKGEGEAIQIVIQHMEDKLN